MVSRVHDAETVKLRGLTLADGSSSGPLIIKRTEQEFIDALLNQLASRDGVAQLAKNRVHTAIKGQPVRLYQPVHRVFNIAMLEIVCDRFGQPRLDPQQIESAGLVVRREWEEPNLAKNSSRRDNHSDMQGWMQSKSILQGWVRFSSPENESLDPDPKFRLPERRIGHPFIDQLLSATSYEPLKENEARLYLAPPEVCTATNKTILYGLIPVTSSEQSETPDLNMPVFSDESVSGHLPSYLRAGGTRQIPRAGEKLTYRDADTSSENIQDTSDLDNLSDFILMLRQLSIEFEAFKEPLVSNPVFQALNAIKLTFTEPGGLGVTTGFTVRPAGDFLRDALDILVNRRGQPATIGAPTSNAPTVQMPDVFPPVTQEQAARILGSVKSAMIRRLGEIAGRPGRFDDPGRRYRLRAFVRLKAENGCPPVTVWSDYSESFTIVPWYESGDAPPTQVALPEITPNFLKNLKPNVSFIVPESLFNLLNKNSPADFVSGNASQAGAKLALDWICSFNIPIITICAFIVLNIFLQLFDIIFHWMLFIKICLPFPKTSR